MTDPATQDALASLYPLASRSGAAKRLGYRRAMLDHIVRGIRRPKPDVAQVISADSGGRLTMANLCGWDLRTRIPGCRVFDSDPMPPARALGDEPYRVRTSDHGAVRYLQEVCADFPPEVAAAAEVVIAHLEVASAEQERGG